MGQKPESVNELADALREAHGAEGGYHCPVAIIECVPNISEGRRAEIVAAIVGGVRRVPVRGCWMSPPMRPTTAR